MLFASIQTLSKPQHLQRFAPDHFAYIVVDEFHHAAADTYRRLLEHFRSPREGALKAVVTHLASRNMKRCSQLDA